MFLKVEIIFADLLNSPHQSNDSELLKVEKSLYQACIQSGERS